MEQTGNSTGNGRVHSSCTGGWLSNEAHGCWWPATVGGVASPVKPSRTSLHDSMPYESSFQCYRVRETNVTLISPKRICSLGLWNVLTLNSPGKPELLVTELIRFGGDISVITEARLTDSGEMIINSSDNEAAYKLYFSGGSSHHNGVAFAVNRRYASCVLYFSPISDRLAVLELEGTV